ncbi:MAG: inorganic diphosphatase [Candidatus Liptonbacteria bacterium]|nr:inorganic diphosphatase [Candidatus Liptonbacteria bacterium]
MEISKIPAGKNPPQEINVFIEIPQGSSVKYEIDKESGAIMVDRLLYTAMAYPFNYGFIPGTHAADGDATDVMVIAPYPLHPGTIAPARPIGMLEMEDEGGVDHKIIAVLTKKIDPYQARIEDITDLDDATKNKIKHFFDHMKEIEPGKWVKTKDFLDKSRAEEEIKKSLI